MQVRLIKSVVEDLPDDEQIVTYWFDKDQANDLAQDIDEEPLTNEEWLVIWEKMSKDKQLNQMADELFNELFYQIINKRKANRCFICGDIATHFEATTDKGACCKCCGDCPENCKGRK
jgi:hypothetical protein